MTLNWLPARLKEPSTKRGIVWLVAGSAVLCGYELAPEQVEKWIGIAMMVAGVMGWLPDEKPALPPIELQARPAAADPVDVPTAVGVLRETTVRPQHNTDEASDYESKDVAVGDPRWNG